jgi:hypothetical protein
MTTADTRKDDWEGEPAAPPPAAILYGMLTGTWVSQTISVLARLGVPDVLADGPLPVSRIAAEVDADPPTLLRLMRALTDLDILVQHEEAAFGLTPLGELLRSDVPGSMRGGAIMMGLPCARHAWTDLYTSIRTGEPAFARVHGTDLFSYLAAHPDDAVVFDTAMQAVSSTFLSTIVAEYDFSPFATIVDVGGGTGTLLAAILTGNPTVHGVLVDRAHVLERAPEVLQQAGVADRCELVEADFFTSVPGGGDLYVLSNILHDWGDDAAVHILRTCRKGMHPGSRLLAVELVLPDGPEPSMAKLLDLEMLALTPNGRQRTTNEYTRLFEAADLAVSHAVPALPQNRASYVEAIPAAAG